MKAGTKLIERRAPTDAERKRGAEVAFDRESGSDRYTVLACRCYESWEQWGAPQSVLWDNVRDVETWRRGKR